MRAETERTIEEIKQAMEGMLAHGEREKIIERRGFSLLDIKRYVESLGMRGRGGDGERQGEKQPHRRLPHARASEPSSFPCPTIFAPIASCRNAQKKFACV